MKLKQFLKPQLDTDGRSLGGQKQCVPAPLTANVGQRFLPVPLFFIRVHPRSSAVTNAFFVTCLLLVFATLSASTAVVPQPVAGWRMELVAEAPQINHPSVVCTAPDGRVFVAEDPMDIRVAADATEGRILCLHPDGRWTVFAEGLHAVFGMQYLEGKLYVLHNPKFSVFDDHEGVGANRRELIEQTNPKPWALDWNDHVPANFKLAMDGYFYMAVGDKGLYGARGTDGREVNLPGGGIVRIRPDGTGLEIHSTGVRNILDVAINAEDEIFTYDNTDEHDWMGRVTHMVEGGFYGYPHEFIPRRPHTLWMMHDLGGGAACGTLCYNEDALPAEYHGNLFLADFGQRQVNRLIIERVGATYRVVKHEKMFPNPPADFRPVGIAWSADGMSMFICDWQHRDEKADVRVGRLWKLTWEGKSNAASKPDWYHAKPVPSPTHEQLAEYASALGHASHDVRLMAQRRLAAADPDEGMILNNAFSRMALDPTNGRTKRRHLLWAKHTAGKAMDMRSELGTLAYLEPDPVIRRQAVRLIGERRDQANEPLLRWLLFDNAQRPNEVPLATPIRPSTDPALRFAAATALGRIANPTNIPYLLKALNEPDLYARYAVFTALNRIGRQHPAAWPAIAVGLSNDSERIREGTKFAIRETYDVQLVNVLAGLVLTNHARESQSLLTSAATSVVARQSALELLAAIHHQPPAWKGEWWAYHPALQPPPEKSVAWEGTEQVRATLRATLADADIVARRIALAGLLAAKDAGAAPSLRERFPIESDLENRQLIFKTLAVIKDDQARPLVVAVLNDPATLESLRLEALYTAGQLGGDPISQAVLGLLKTDGLSPALLLAAIDTVALLKPANASAALHPHFTSADAKVRESALAAVIKISPEQALDLIRPLLQQGDPAIRGNAVKALGRVRDPRATDLLLAAYAQPATRDAAIQALTRRPDVRAVPAYLAGLDSADFQLREASRGALQSIRREAWPEVEPRLKDVSLGGMSLLKKIYNGDHRAKQHFKDVPDILEPREYLEYAVRQNGDADEGRRLFHDLTGLACISCHRVGDQGVSLGPDLSGVGAQFSRHELSASILFPSKAVREGYQAIEIETKDDASFSGLAKGETATEVLLIDRTGQLQRISKDKISARHNSEFSLMPEGLQTSLTLEQFAGLISYLESLKGNPTPTSAK